MAQLSEETKKSVAGMTMGRIGKSAIGIAKGTSSAVNSIFKKREKKPEKFIPHFSDNPTDMLGQIYKMLKVIDDDKRLHQEMANSHIEEQEHEKNKRNVEIIKALTIRRKTKKAKKTKPEKKETPPAPPTTGATTPKATPKTTTPTTPATPPKVTEPPVTPPTATKEAPAVWKNNRKPNEPAKSTPPVTASPAPSVATSTAAAGVGAVTATKIATTGIVGATVAEAVAARIAKRESAGNNPDSLLMANFVAEDKRNPKKPHDVSKSNRIEKGNIDITTGKPFEKSLTEMSIDEVIELSNRRNKYFGQNGAGAAMGKYQFMPGTLRDMSVSAFGSNYGSMPFNSATQEKLNLELITSNAQKLQKAGLPITDASLYMMHFFGNTTQTKMVLDGKDTDSMKDILDFDGKIRSKANPRIAALTVGKYKELYLSKSFDFKSISFNDLGKKADEVSTENKNLKGDMSAQRQKMEEQQHINLLNQVTPPNKKVDMTKPNDSNPLLDKVKAG
jgi:hypothetical protein